MRFISGFQTAHTAFQNWKVSAVVEFKESSSLDEVWFDLFASEGYNLEAFEIAVSNLETEMGNHFSTSHPW